MPSEMIQVSFLRANAIFIIKSVSRKPQGRKPFSFSSLPEKSILKAPSITLVPLTDLSVNGQVSYLGGTSLMYATFKQIAHKIVREIK